MNAIIETLNRWGGRSLGFAWPMLWQSSLLIAVLFALDFMLRRKLRAAVRYALWLVVLVKLLLPPSLALPTGLGWWLRPATVTPAKLQTTSVVVSEAPILAPSLPVPEPVSLTPPPRVPMSASAWVFVAWCVASVGLLAWLVVRWWQVACGVRRAGPAPDSVNQSLGEARHLAGLRRAVRLRLTDRPMSPAVCGLFRPVVVLPRALTEQLAPAQLRAVLLHELTHLRRGDVWVNCAQALLQIVYWWHPLLWLANARIRRVREEAVDDAVMLALREDAETYAPTLLEVAKLAFKRPLATLGLVGILESRSALRQRIERLVDYRAPRRAGLSVLSLLCIAVFAALAAPMGEPPSLPVGNTAQFIEVTAEIDITGWSSRGTESHSTHTTRCVVGTDAWMMEHDFMRNATMTSWFTGTQIVEHIVVTKKRPDPANPAITFGPAPEVGEQFTQARPSVDGCAASSRPDTVPWLAFCSGAYLKYPGRRVPLPFHDGLRIDHVREYTDTTVVFEDSLGLPGRIDFHTPDNHLVCHYEVQQSTNFLGWSLPLRFEVIRYRPGTNDAWAPHSQAVGRVISLRNAEKPEIPADVLKQIPPTVQAQREPASSTHEGQPKQDANAAPPSEQTNRVTVPSLSDLPLYGRFFRAEGETKRSLTPNPQKIEASNQVQDGKVLWEMGRFTEAEAKLNAALEADPGNKAALYYLALVKESQTGKPKPPSGRQRIIGKLNRIRLSSVLYDDLPLAEVVRRLAGEVWQLDPEKEGIVFRISPDTPMPVGSAEPIALDTVRIKINPALTNIRLADVLDAIVKTADKPIKYSVEDYGILFSARTTEIMAPLYTRQFKFSTDTFFANVRKQAGVAKTSSPEALSQAIRKLFTDAGVDLKAPRTVFVNDR